MNEQQMTYWATADATLTLGISDSGAKLQIKRGTNLLPIGLRDIGVLVPDHACPPVPCMGSYNGSLDTLAQSLAPMLNYDAERLQVQLATLRQITRQVSCVDRKEYCASCPYGIMASGRVQ